MYPTLYHFIYDTLGISIPILKIVNSFGLFVALAFIAAAYFLKLELDRKYKEGVILKNYKKSILGARPSIYNMVSTGFFGFVLGFKLIYILLNSSTALDDPQAFLLSTQGSIFGGIIIAAIFLGLLYKDYAKSKKKYPEKVEEEVEITSKEHAWNMAVYAAIFGFAGAKLFHLFENPDQLIAFFTNFEFGNLLSGLTMYGGLILGAAGVMWYLRKNGISIWEGSDAVVPGLMLAYGIGRIGCQVAGDGDWGINNTAEKPSLLSWIPDWMWSYHYPNNVNAVGEPIVHGPCFDGYCTQLSVGVFPTPFYETLMAIGIFIILWKLRKKIKIPGVLFFLYLTFNGIERFWIEKIRVNNDFLTVGGWTMTQAELIALILIISGILGSFFLILRNRRIESQ